MNALLGIAYIAKRLKRPNTVRSLAFKRNRQLNRQWAKEKTLASTRAVN
jgi:hypothetical protein